MGIFVVRQPSFDNIKELDKCMHWRICYPPLLLGQPHIILVNFCYYLSVEITFEGVGKVDHKDGHNREPF